MQGDEQRSGPRSMAPPFAPLTSVSVVVPVFGDGADLEDLTRRVVLALEPIASTWELIFVNDGSAGPAWDIIVRLSQGRVNVRGIDLQRNFGQHNALLAGIRAAQG